MLTSGSEDIHCSGYEDTHHNWLLLQGLPGNNLFPSVKIGLSRSLIQSMPTSGHQSHQTVSCHTIPAIQPTLLSQPQAVGASPLPHSRSTCAEQWLMAAFALHGDSGHLHWWYLPYIISNLVNTDIIICSCGTRKLTFKETLKELDVEASLQKVLHAISKIKWIVQKAQSIILTHIRKSHLRSLGNITKEVNDYISTQSKDTIEWGRTQIVSFPS